MIASVSPPRVTILHGTYTIQKYTSSSAHQTSFMKREICSLAQRPWPHRHMLRRGSREQRQWASSRAKRGARNSNTEIDYHHPHKKPHFVHPINPQFQLRQRRRALLKKKTKHLPAITPPFQMGTMWRYELLTFLICHSEKAFSLTRLSACNIRTRPGRKKMLLFTSFSKKVTANTILLLFHCQR